MSPSSNELIFFVNGRKVTESNVDPEVTLLTFLRRNLGLTGTKSACGGGGCGACTVMLSRHDPASGKPRHFSVTACLVPLCSLHGAAVTTVEGVGSIRTRVHPVQERVAKSHGTQCGFCTPGMVMSLYTLLRNHPQPTEEQLLEALAGNLCRCTGYRPILESGRTFCSASGSCGQRAAGQCGLDQPGDDSWPAGNSGLPAPMCSELFTTAEFQPLDPTQEPIFPPELARMAESPERHTLTFRGDRVTWVSPGTLQELLGLRAQHPNAPLVLGNTALGEWTPPRAPGATPDAEGRHGPSLGWLPGPQGPGAVRNSRPGSRLKGCRTAIRPAPPHPLSPRGPKAQADPSPDRQEAQAQELEALCLGWGAGCPAEELQSSGRLCQIRRLGGDAFALHCCPIRLSPESRGSRGQQRARALEDPPSCRRCGPPLHLGGPAPALAAGIPWGPYVAPSSRACPAGVPSSTPSPGLTIGAGCSLAQVQDIMAKSISELPEQKTRTLRALSKALHSLAGQQIRNLASLGGHVVSRHSYSDLNPVLAVGRAALNLRSEGGARLVPLDEHFLAGEAKAGLQPGEIVESVHIPHTRQREFVFGFRQAQARQNAVPHVSAGMRVLFKEGTDTIEDLSIAYGGVGTTTVMAPRSCQQLLGRPWTEVTLDEACRLVLGEVAMPGSAPGGRVEFRRTLLVSFLFRFYLQVLHELKMCWLPRPLSDSCWCPHLPDRFLSALEDFPVTVPRGVQTYQSVDPQQPSRDPVGRPVMHLSGLKHATGEAVFCDDLPRVDRELCMALVTSSRPHAKILSVDPSEALRLPEVVSVITAEDIPGTNGAEDDRLLAVDEVLCVGQIICAVVAETDMQAKRAAAEVRVTYEDLQPSIFSIQDAIMHSSFLCPEKKLERGSVAEAFGEVDHVVEGEVHVGGQEHFYMETQRVLVVPKAEDQELDIFVSTQDPAHVQKTVSSTLNVPLNRVTCHVKRVGGGFGGKVGRPASLGAIAALGAVKTGRPVRLILDREEDMLITGGRHPLFGKYKVGFRSSGRIKALDIECYINGGCTLDHSEVVTEFLLLKLENAYKIRNLRLRARACRTNLPSNTAFRGFGFPQGALVTESCITAMAAKCGLPPEKVREKNMYRAVDKAVYQQAFSPEPLALCWAECLARADLQARREQIDAFNQQSRWRKRGIAAVPMKFSVGFAASSYHQAAALVHVYTDGSVLVTHGGNELGQGIHTKMLQVASRELQIPMSRLHIQETCTATVPNTVATAASIGADVNGRAVQNACQTLLKRLEPIIKKNPEGIWEDWIDAAFEQRISLSATGYFRGYKAFMDWEKGEGDPFPYYVFGAACSEVEIDCLTGAHRKLRTDIVMDAGCSLNPAIDVGQVEGAFLQGAGLYTSEELHYSPGGALLSRGPNEYKIPTVADIPEEFNVTLLPSSPSQTQLTIYSSKGLGESGMFLGSSVFFAIGDAVAAVRRDRDLAEDFTVRSPATPEWVRMACVDRFTEMIPRDDPGTFKPWSVPIA
ncbi:aldehyde oxidase 2-like [Fukomys damarensis]|uniref:aldehyde oxidase 2-like n=1 Tax=Fukomys damarensis TaxID=885580 RepID=UPI0005400924|nr:aldehyde oxidase 2-like [Fukomys damarensis]